VQAAARARAAAGVRAPAKARARAPAKAKAEARAAAAAVNAGAGAEAEAEVRKQGREQTETTSTFGTGIGIVIGGTEIEIVTGEAVLHAGCPSHHHEGARVEIDTMTGIETGIEAGQGIETEVIETDPVSHLRLFGVERMPPFLHG